MDRWSKRQSPLSPAAVRLLAPFPQAQPPGNGQLTNSDNFEPRPVPLFYLRGLELLSQRLRVSESTMAAANVLSTLSNPVMPKSHVGFDSITNQIERKLLKRGFQFNVICVGEYILRTCLASIELTRGSGQTGLGKSTLINTIFASHLIDSKGRLTPTEPVRATTEIQAVSHGTSPFC